MDGDQVEDVKHEQFNSRPLLKDVAYEKLRALIVSGTLPQGAFLAERRLAEVLNMSKTPVKSALERLESEGFITISPQQGVVVRTPSRNEILDLIELRLALETLAVSRVAQRGLTFNQQQGLRSNLAAQEVALQAQDVPGMAELDIAFHLLLCEALGNRQVLQVMTLLKARLQQMAFFVSSKASGRMENSLREHQRLFEAIEQRDVSRATSLLERHLEYGKQFLIQR